MKRTKRISISIDLEDLKIIDEKRGIADRSKIFRELIRIGMREKGWLPEELTTKKIPVGGLRRAY